MEIPGNTWTEAKLPTVGRTTLIMLKTIMTKMEDDLLRSEPH